MRTLIAAAALAVLLQGCASWGARRDEGLPPCTPSSRTTDACDATRMPRGVEYPKPQEEQGRPSQAERDIERHRSGSAQPGD
jgi:hypothetical protein